MGEEKKEVMKTTSDNPLVFISHDTRDAEIAEEFSGLLKRVSAGVLKSFRSSDKKGTQGIEYGVEWYPEIIKNIQNATDVVCLLTQQSVDRPWILFEAGMAKGKISTSILGVALGMTLKKASTGPFAQFQNCGDDEDSLCKLVFQLVDRIPNSEPDDETILIHVRKFKTNIDKIFKNKQKQPEIDSSISLDDNSTVKLFEEIKVMFKDLPSRIDKNVSIDYRNKKRRRFDPMIFEDLMHISNDQNIGLLITLSSIKDKMPWIYDIGLETIRILNSNKSISIKNTAIENLIRTIEISFSHPIMREFMNDNKEEYMLSRELPRILINKLASMITR